MSHERPTKGQPPAESNSDEKSNYIKVLDSPKEETQLSKLSSADLDKDGTSLILDDQSEVRSIMVDEKEVQIEENKDETDTADKKKDPSEKSLNDTDVINSDVIGESSQIIVKSKESGGQQDKVDE